MLSLSVVATATAKKVRVVVDPVWNQPLNAYFVTALPPGNRKSAVYTAATRPLERFLREEARRLTPEIRKASTLKRIAAKRLKSAEGEAAKAEDLEKEELERVAEALAEELERIHVPVVPRLIADDVTPEKLISLLVEQGGRMAVLSEEGGIFGLMAGRYNKEGGPNFEVYLKAWDGGEIRVDRIGRASEHIHEPAVTLGLTVQPVVLEGLTFIPGFRGRGLLARFFYSLPTSWVGRRETNPPSMPESVRATYERKVLALLRLPWNEDRNGRPIHHDLCFTSEARTMLDSFSKELEPRLRPFADLELYADWVTKLAGGVVRIAGLLHMAKHAELERPWAMPLAGETMQAALQIGHYLIPHAKAAFQQMSADPAVEAAKLVLRWIVRHGEPDFTKREAFNDLRLFGRADALDAPLALLVIHKYIRPAVQELRSGPGRKPSPEFEVNPHLATQNSHNAQNPLPPGHSADSADSAGPIPDETDPSMDDARPDADLEEGVI